MVEIDLPRYEVWGFHVSENLDCDLIYDAV
jgi:hypothetical protein